MCVDARICLHLIEVKEFARKIFLFSLVATEENGKNWERRGNDIYMKTKSVSTEPFTKIQDSFSALNHELCDMRVTGRKKVNALIKNDEGHFIFLVLWCK